MRQLREASLDSPRAPRRRRAAAQVSAANSPAVAVDSPTVSEDTMSQAKELLASLQKDGVSAEFLPSWRNADLPPHSSTPAPLPRPRRHASVLETAPAVAYLAAKAVMALRDLPVLSPAPTCFPLLSLPSPSTPPTWCARIRKTRLLVPRSDRFETLFALFWIPTSLAYVSLCILPRCSIDDLPLAHHLAPSRSRRILISCHLLSLVFHQPDGPHWHFHSDASTSQRPTDLHAAHQTSGSRLE